ncbi:MAG TPA: type II secretion system F family protein [bacterium]|nr:type II secretion system F family protein [bacterium]HPT30002.1 type II secretion system F family protein [bacterium]
MARNKHRLAFFLLRHGWAKESKENFLENLAMLLSAGLDIYGALDAVQAENRSRLFRRLVNFLISEIENGSTLWQALEKTGTFPRQAVSLIRNGEKSGNLPDNLKVLVAQRQKEQGFYGKIRSAMIYPLFVLSLAVVVGLGTSWFVLPRLAQVFSSLDVKLPAITQWLIDFGYFMAHYGYIFVPAVLAFLIIFFFFLFFFKYSKFLGQFFLLRLPGIKKLIKQAEVARGTYILGTLLNSGLPIVEAMDSLIQSSDIRAYRRFYEKLKVGLEEGNSFRKIFSQNRTFSRFWSPAIEQLILAAETSGNLPNVLLKISSSFEEKVSGTSKNLAVLIEPILLIIVWLAVLAVAVAIFLPIYSLVGSFNH